MRLDTRLLFCIIAAMGVGNIAFGLMTQLVPLAMNDEGDSKFLIGGNVMVGQAGVMLAGFLLVRLRAQFKSHSLVMGAMVLALVAYAGFALTTPLYAWYFWRFVVGMAGAVIYTTGESWLQNNSTEANRGRVIAAYMMSQTFTFALGPFFIIPWTGVAGWLPWSFCFLPVLLALGLEAFVKVEEVAKGQAPAGLWATVRGAKFIFLSIGVVTLFEAIMLTFFGLYAKDHGYTDGSASQLLSFGIAAPMLLFFPIGWLADHWSRRGMMMLCGLAAVVAALAVPLAIEGRMIWPLIAFLRASSFGVLLVGYAMLGGRYQGREMVAAASINSLIWGATGVVGPPLAGLAFDTYGLWLLPWLMAACFVPVLLALTTQIKAAN